MKQEFIQEIRSISQADAIEKKEKIQTLWSGYGEIIRIKLHGGSVDSVIVKHIDLQAAQEHPRGWNTNTSHQRKIKSYEVEIEWYRQWNSQSNFRIPKCLGTKSIGNNHIIVLEDLNASGYPVRKSELNLDTAKECIKWLAQFHGYYMGKKPTGLWSVGTYWHLDTRPDEWNEMQSGILKTAASSLDQQLSSAKYQTIVHGDAKVANFCFSTNLNQVAAVDFQYVGGGCGMKDVAYFMGSCFTEEECERYESEILEYYFKHLKNTLINTHPEIKAEEVEIEWRALYAVAWADFTRFLLGWMPMHQKINGYSEKMVGQVLKK
jgi:hypothetical protein